MGPIVCSHLLVRVVYTCTCLLQDDVRLTQDPSSILNEYLGLFEVDSACISELSRITLTEMNLLPTVLALISNEPNALDTEMSEIHNDHTLQNVFTSDASVAMH